MLTLRELMVMKLVSEGWHDKEIAEHLDLSEHTVKQHVKNSLRKLHAKNRTQAAVTCVREGLFR